MKEVHCRLLDLPILHPRLLWETIILAGASVLEGIDRRAPYRFLILAEDIPGFGSEELILTIDPSGYDEESIVRLRRTFELARQVELAAIAVAALALALSKGHEIVDVALRGSAADYYPGKKDHHKRVTTERPHPTGGSCPREGHGKGKLIRILFSRFLAHLHQCTDGPFSAYFR